MSSMNELETRTAALIAEYAVALSKTNARALQQLVGLLQSSTSVSELIQHMRSLRLAITALEAAVTTTPALYPATVAGYWLLGCFTARVGIMSGDAEEQISVDLGFAEAARDHFYEIAPAEPPAEGDLN